MSGWNFDHSYALLPGFFYSRQRPMPVRDPEMVLLNTSLAKELGLDAEVLAGETGATIFSGNELPEDADPIAQAYAGHQFGGFSILGDGRAVLLGEQLTPSGERVDLQLKGSGQTRYSRRGDGKAALGPMLREYLISEAMNALTIPTTRSLAVVKTGEPVFREELLQGAVLARTASSHIRVGTFQYAAAQGSPKEVQILADYTIQRHFPALADADHPYFSLLDAVIDRQSALVARWLGVGFIHGVMNTDNVSICGETIDYGPCAFMDRYDPSTVFSSIDRQGRYAYGRQSKIMQWNLARFAETLLPLIHPDAQEAIDLANEALKGLEKRFQADWLAVMRAKLGLFSEEEGDVALIEDFLEDMHREKADFTNTFRSLSEQRQSESLAFLVDWMPRWKDRLARQAEPLDAAYSKMNAHNPAVIPRNYRVEEALNAAVQGDMTSFHALLSVLLKPYEAPPSAGGYHLPPPASSPPYHTFCGT